MKKSKVLLLLVCAVLLVAASVLGTLAWLADESAVTNTFTVGQVDIKVDEAKVNPDGTVIPGADRVQENNYHLIPGKTYVKDPTMTVVKDSADSYVRMLLTINCMKEFDEIYSPEIANLTQIFDGYDSTVWNYVSTVRDDVTNTVTYEFRYHKVVKESDTDTVLEPLFTSITVPGEFDCNDMALIEDLKITVVGHAIQQSGFADASSAWVAFDAQMNP